MIQRFAVYAVVLGATLVLMAGVIAGRHHAAQDAAMGVAASAAPAMAIAAPGTQEKPKTPAAPAKPAAKPKKRVHR